MPIGNGYQTYSDSTLKNLKKDTLIKYIRVLEENLRNAYERLDNQAKILHDSEPVKHGKWKSYPECGTTRCSECDWTIEECWGSKFCPDCGAKMDLEAIDETD